MNEAALAGSDNFGEFEPVLRRLSYPPHVIDALIAGTRSELTQEVFKDICAQAGMSLETVLRDALHAIQTDAVRQTAERQRAHRDALVQRMKLSLVNDATAATSSAIIFDEPTAPLPRRPRSSTQIQKAKQARKAARRARKRHRKS